ncbi:hypothetical protein ACFL5Q_06380 [Planctomycetota bacterium]
MHRRVAWVALAISAAVLAVVCLWTRPNEPDVRMPEAPAGPTVGDLEDEFDLDTDAAGPESPTVTSTPPASQPPAPKAIHPLLNEAEESVLAEGNEELPSTAEPELAEVIRAVAQAADEAGEPNLLTADVSRRAVFRDDAQRSGLRLQLHGLPVPPGLFPHPRHPRVLLPIDRRNQGAARRRRAICRRRWSFISKIRSAISI